MPKKLTTALYVEKARKKHGEAYDYLSEYVSSKTKMIIRCRKHDHIFEQDSAAHLMGQGCTLCWAERRGPLSRKGFESSKERAMKIFGDKYLKFYTPVDFTTQQTKLTLDCGVDGHGPSTITWQNHIRGVHCSKCSMDKTYATKTKSTAEFLEEIAKVLKHVGLYDYSRVDYKKTYLKIEIICKFHKESFWMTPMKHLSGQGCPKCAKCGYSRDKPGSFYVLTSGNITKIGITGRKVKERTRQINTSSNKGFEILTSFSFDDGEIPWQLEDILLKELRSTHKQPTEKYDGSTECFYDVDHNILLSRIQELILKQSAEIA